MTNIEALDTSVDLLSALLWQNNEDNELQSILTQKQTWYDLNQSQFWNDWITDVFDLRTANTFGLSVWSIILGIPLELAIGPSPLTKPTFGFGSFNKNFNNGNFSNFKSSSISTLTIEEQRLVLQLRYFKLISRCTIPDVNRMLNYVFKSRGIVYVLDNDDMEFINYVFTFAPGEALLNILREFDVLPRPAAIGIKYLIVVRPVFGFGPFNKNFNNGNFYNKEGL